MALRLNMESNDAIAQGCRQPSAATPIGAEVGLTQRTYSALDELHVEASARIGAPSVAVVGLARPGPIRLTSP
jgi:hypothetical protein